MAVTFTNNACSAISGAIDNVVTAITIGPEGVFFPQLSDPTDWFYGTISSDPIATSQLPEIVKVTNITINGGTGDYDLVVERGAGMDGAAPKSWSDASDFQLLVNSEMLEDLRTSGVALAGATSYLLNSKTITSDYTTTDADNGYMINASPGAGVDIDITLHAIPTSAIVDHRIVFNKRTNTADGNVVITAFAGQTLNGLTSVTLSQQYSSVTIQGRAGEINWDVIESVGYETILNDSKPYGFVRGVGWQIVPGEAPISGVPQVRLNGGWAAGVEEAPVNGLQHVRVDAAWAEYIPPEDISSPTGTVTAFAGAAAPEGWFLCDGTAYSQTTYAALYAVIGLTYEQNTASDFKVPDLRGRNIRGLDNMGGSAANIYTGRNTLGGIHGAQEWILQAGQLAAHTHGMSQAPNHSHSTITSAQVGGATNGSNSSIIDLNGTGTIGSTSSAGAHSHTITSTGSNDPIESASPFMDMNYIIKY